MKIFIITSLLIPGLVLGMGTGVYAEEPVISGDDTVISDPEDELLSEPEEIVDGGSCCFTDESTVISDPEDGLLSEPEVIVDGGSYYFTDESTRNTILQQAETTPEQYSLLEQGYVTPVKLQSPFGNCWAFASTAAAETSLLSSGLADEGLDLSEKHLAYFTATPVLDQNSSQYGEGYKVTVTGSEKLNLSGYSFLASSVYANGAGPVQESADPSLAYRGVNGIKDYHYFQEKYRPYSYSADDDWDIPYDLRDFQSYALKESYVLPTPAKIVDNKYEYDEAATLAIKEQLMEGRAVEIGFLADKATPSDGQVESKTMSNDWANYGDVINYSTHAVTIVGWDDTIGSENSAVQFKEDKKPPYPGAWLVKNSWGSGQEEFPNYGDGNWGIPEQLKDEDGNPVYDDAGNPVMVGSGYFWLSYYEASLCYPEALEFEAADPDLTTQAYDYMPVNNMIASTYENEAKMSNFFKASRGEQLEQLAFQTTYPGTTVKYEVYLLQAVTGNHTDGYKIAEGVNTYKYGGFHKVTLEEPVRLLKDQFYSIVVTETTADGKYTVSVPANFSDSFKGVINEGESAVYLNGIWKDLSDKELQDELGQSKDIADPALDNFSIKGYTRPLESQFSFSLTGNTTLSFVPGEDSAELTLEVRGQDDTLAETLRFEWELDDPELADLEMIKNGTAAKITAKRDAEGKCIDGQTYLLVSAYAGGEFLGKKAFFINIKRPEMTALYCDDETIRDTGSATYTGNPIEPPMSAVDMDGRTMVQGKDYTIEYKNQIKCGAVTVTAAAKGDYKPATKSYYFAIKPEKAVLKKVSAGDESLTVTVEDQSASCLSGYQVQYREKDSKEWTGKKFAGEKTTLTIGNLKAGKQYEVRVCGYTEISDYQKYDDRLKQYYYGEYSPVQTSDAVRKSIAGTTIEIPASVVYTGREIQPKVTVKDGSTVLKLNTDYSVTCSDNKDVGTAKATVKGIGRYSGSVTKTFKILKAENSISKLTPAEKKLKAATLSRKNLTFRLRAADQFGAKKTFALDSSTPAKAKKHITVSGTGRVTVKKGTPKGTYPIRVKISAAGTGNYRKAAATKKVTIIVQ